MWRTFPSRFQPMKGFADSTAQNFAGIMSSSTEMQMVNHASWHTILFSLLLALQLLLCGGAVSWTKRNPIVTVVDMKSVTYGNGLYVAVGDGPTILTSPDLINWATNELPREEGSNVGWFVTFNPKLNMFIVAGGQNPTFTSSDGLTWQKQDLNNEDYLCRMVYGNGVVIAAPLDGAYVYYTVDGINWGFSQVDPYFDVVGVTFANGVFLAYGDAPYHTGAIYSSTNGTAWKLYSNISLDISYSIDQIDSISQGPGSSLFATVDLYASSSIGAIVMSPDGKDNWRIVYTLNGGYSLGHTSYGKGVYFAQVYTPSTGEVLLTSRDNGNSWQVVPPSVIPNQVVPDFLNNNWVVAGPRGQLQSSQDGKTWNNVDEGISNYLQQYLFNPKKREFYLTFNNPSFSGGGILASSDGITWKTIYNQIYGIVSWQAGLNQWAASDGSNIYVSPDMRSWNTIQGPTLPTSPASIVGVAYGNGVWVAAVDITNTNHLPFGYAVYVAQGPNPSSPSAWTVSLSSSRLLSSIGGVVFGNGVFILGGLQYSTNGLNWTAGPPALPAVPSFVGPDQNGYFVLLGGDGSYSASINGNSWTNGIRLDSANHSIASLDWLPFQGVFIASATDGSLFIAKQILSQQAWQPFANSLPTAFGQSGATDIYSDGSRYVAVQTRDNLIYTAN